MRRTLGGAAIACALMLFPTTVSGQVRRVTIESSIAEEKAEVEILHRLAQPVADGIPAGDISDLVRYVERRGIRCYLDERALDDAVIGTDSRYQRTPREIPLRTALDLVLDQLDLAWTIRSPVLIITTLEVAESRLKTCGFNVTNLLPLRTMVDYGGRAYQGRDYDTLIEVIQSTVDPATWDEVGGTGSIEPIGVNGQALLVVSQTDPIMLKVEQLLWNLHRLSWTPMPAPPATGSRSSAIRSSQLPTTQVGNHAAEVERIPSGHGWTNGGMF